MVIKKNQKSMILFQVSAIISFIMMILACGSSENVVKNAGNIEASDHAEYMYSDTTNISNLEIFAYDAD